MNTHLSLLIRQGLVLLAVLLATAPLTGLGGDSRPTASDAEELAETIVRKHDLQLGFDEEKKTLVAIGVTSKEVAAPATDRRFMTMRERMAKSAALKAKAEIMHGLAPRIAIFDATELRMSDRGAFSSTTSVTELFSHLVLCGFQTICTAESWNDGIYQVAVAIGWSEKSERNAREALSSPPPSATSSKILPEASPEWREWAEKEDFSTMVGARSFVDARGQRRYVGIGFADIDGKAGKALLMAKRLARVKATQNLVYALYSDSSARELSVQGLATLPGKEDAGSQVFEHFEEMISQKCKGIHIIDQEVYTTTVTHPISGRKIFVSLSGIEPERLKELNLLPDGAR